MNALLRVLSLLKPDGMKNDNHGLTDEENDRIAREAERVRADFDEAFYLAQNPDVAAANLNPLLHFLVYGWKEGRDPDQPHLSGPI